jgi:hypothetical protein
MDQQLCVGNGEKLSSTRPQIKIAKGDCKQVARRIGWSSGIPQFLLSEAIIIVIIVTHAELLL